MIIGIEEATLIAERAVKAIAVSNNDEYVIVDVQPDLGGKGWLFFYNTRAFCESGDFLDMLAGNGPILVSFSGEIQVIESFNN